MHNKFEHTGRAACAGRTTCSQHVAVDTHDRKRQHVTHATHQVVLRWRDYCKEFKVELVIGSHLPGRAGSLPNHGLLCLLLLPLQPPPLHLFLPSFALACCLILFPTETVLIQLFSHLRAFPCPFIHAVIEIVQLTGMQTKRFVAKPRTILVTQHGAAQIRCASSKSTVPVCKPATARADSVRKAPLANHKKSVQSYSRIDKTVL